MPNRNSKKSNSRKDEAVQHVLHALERDYVSRHPRAKIDVRRYGKFSIWVRIIDPDVAGTSIFERDEPWDILRVLPEDVFTQISLLFVITPKEAKTSPTNMEFEEAIPAGR